jgi:TDG/mug DNA glycosylase family protein
LVYNQRFHSKTIESHQQEARVRPKRSDLLAAQEKTVPDILGQNLRVLFVGINPGLYSAAVGHHFARPGNRFWPVLYAAGFTPRLLSPAEEILLVEYGCGITNLVARATASAAQLETSELLAGGRLLEVKVTAYRPRLVAVLGIGAYRHAFQNPTAGPGLQVQGIAGAPVWVLPNPSGLNAHYQLDTLTQLFCQLRLASERIDPN